MARNFETGAGAFDREFPFHFGQAGRHMEEEARRRYAGFDRFGVALLSCRLLRLCTLPQGR